MEVYTTYLNMWYVVIVQIIIVTLPKFLIIPKNLGGLQL